jgi:hypothetical protein
VIILGTQAVISAIHTYLGWPVITGTWTNLIMGTHLLYTDHQRYVGLLAAIDALELCIGLTLFSNSQINSKIESRFPTFTFTDSITSDELFLLLNIVFASFYKLTHSNATN